MASKVYFTSMRLATNDSIPAKLARLLKAAGLAELDLDKKFVAIKTHFGEYGNASFLKPLYARTIAQKVRGLGGMPFITDCNTLYPGMRKDALSHIECANANGFNRQSCDAEIIIADGLKGSDQVTLPVPGAPEKTLLKEAYIGRAIMDADCLITLSHLKGCTSVAYGGVIKNLAMGCASRAGKMSQHSDGIPVVNTDACIGCRACLEGCGQNAIEFIDKRAHITDACVGCGHCIAYCARNAIMSTFNASAEQLQKKMAEYAAAVTAAQTCFHVGIAIDITPQCDCFPGNDAPVVPNIGMFASLDPVALDNAAIDMINQQNPISTSALPGLHDACECKTDHVHALNPSSDWEICQNHAVELGVGSREYELIEVK